MPLTLANQNEVKIIQRIGGTDEVKHHLKNLGFVAGSYVTLITKYNGNVIVSIKDARVALSEALARKIIVRGENIWH